MSKTYQDFISKSRSEKIVLCHIEPAQRLLIWELDSGAQYKRAVDYFVIGLSDGLTEYSEGSLPLNQGEWFFDSENGIVYIRTLDDSSPDTRDIVATYRLFYSNAPWQLPHDLLNGSEVEYEGRLKSNSAINRELDDEQIGIALESGTTVVFENNDGYFDNIFDILFFENKQIFLYSWSPSIPLSEKRLLFKGEIQNKSFNPSSVSFSCKDFIYKLRERLKLESFAEGDGNISDSILGTPKRRIYGQVDNVSLVPIDNILDGYLITGTVSSNAGSQALTGVGTVFLDELSPGDNLVLEFELETIEVTIESIESDTSLTLSDTFEFGFSNQPVINQPVIPWRKKNRKWHIAGHKLRSPNTTISSASQPNRFSVTDGSDMFDGDLIDVGGFDVTIKRIVGNEIVLRQNLPSGTPSPGTVVSKNPVSKAYVSTKESFINRDWTLNNGAESILEFNDLVEFNIAPQRLMAGTLTFTSGSRVVSATGTDLLNQVQIRDWVRSDDVSHADWYEILDVDEGQLILRTAYGGANNTGSAFKKNISPIGDNTLITANCIGYEYNGEWVKTASDAVKHLLESDSGVTDIDTGSFEESDADAPYILSMVIPEKIGGSVPVVRDVITKINESVFGSLVNDTDFNLVYNILTPEKPSTLERVTQDEIIGEPSIRSRNEIIRKINLNYRPFTDRFKEEDSFKNIELESEFVDRYIGNRQELDITVFLYSDVDARAIAERYLFYNSLSQSTVTIKGKLNFALKNLNDKMFIELDRIYKRFGGRDRRKIGIISKISKDGVNTSVEFSDLGNIFNRCMSIAPDTANDFTTASEIEKIFNAYICDDNLDVPDITSDKELGTQVIG